MQPEKIPLEERIIFALDVEDPERAKALVERLESRIRFYKVGLQLFLAGGFPLVDWITACGHKVMLDLKFFDVPETVRLAVRQLENRRITFTTIHGNDQIVKAAVSANAGVKILAVTVLTSFGEEDVREFLGYPIKVEDLVLSRARQAIASGAGGIVCSGREAGLLRKALGNDFLIVTPGIRPKNTEAGKDDQKRIITAGQAIGLGADHVVVGRPIRDAADPLAVIDAMREEIARAVSP